MDVDKIYKLIISPNFEDKLLGANLLDQSPNINKFIKKYMKKADIDSSGPFMHWSANYTQDCIFIEGNFGRNYYFGSDGFSIDTDEQRAYWESFETLQSWRK